MRAVEQRGAPIDATFLRAMDECVQCRGCEAACPSGVQFGHLMEDTRSRAAARPPHPVAATGRGVVRVSRRCCRTTAVLLASTWCVLVAPAPAPRADAGSASRASGRAVCAPLDVADGGEPDAWLFTGCVMDAWMRDTHRATARVMRAAGAQIARPRIARGVLRRAARARRPRRRSTRARSARDRVDARDRRRSSSTARDAARA